MRLGVRPKADLKRVRVDARVDARVSLPFTNHRIPMRRELIDDKSEPWTDFERMLDTNVGDAISFIHRRIFRRPDFSRSYWGRLYLILMIDWILQLNAFRVLLRYISSSLVYSFHECLMIVPIYQIDPKIYFFVFVLRMERG